MQRAVPWLRAGAAREPDSPALRAGPLHEVNGVTDHVQGADFTERSQQRAGPLAVECLNRIRALLGLIDPSQRVARPDEVLRLMRQLGELAPISAFLRRAP